MVERVDDALGEAIEGLYRAFEAYRLRPWTAPCLHCHTEQDEQAVRRRPLRDLQPQDLAGFAGDALMTWGEVVDLKHFLPRLFEILAREGFPGHYPDMETVVGALGRGGWRAWPAAERAAVDRFLMALWHEHLLGYPAVPATDTVISAIASAADDLAPYLDAWRHTDGTAPALHFGRFLVENQSVAAGRRLANPWLRQRIEQERQVRRWLVAATGPFVPRLEAAFLAASDEATLEMLATALDLARGINPPTDTG